MSRGADTLKIVARAKRALIALEWADGTPIERIESSFSVNSFNAVAAGDVRSIAGSIRFRLRSAYEIAIVALPVIAPGPEAMDALFLQLEFGIPGEALSLLTLRVALSRADRLMLVGAGCCTPAAIWTVRPDDLRQRLPKSLADKLESVLCLAKTLSAYDFNRIGVALHRRIAIAPAHDKSPFGSWRE